MIVFKWWSVKGCAIPQISNKNIKNKRFVWVVATYFFQLALQNFALAETTNRTLSLSQCSTAVFPSVSTNVPIPTGHHPTWARPSSKIFSERFLWLGQNTDLGTNDFYKNLRTESSELMSRIYQTHRRQKVRQKPSKDFKGLGPVDNSSTPTVWIAITMTNIKELNELLFKNEQVTAHFLGIFHSLILKHFEANREIAAKTTFKTITIRTQIPPEQFAIELQKIMEVASDIYQKEFKLEIRDGTHENLNVELAWKVWLQNNVHIGSGSTSQIAAVMANVSKAGLAGAIPRENLDEWRVEAGNNRNWLVSELRKNGISRKQFLTQLRGVSKSENPLGSLNDLAQDFIKKGVIDDNLGQRILNYLRDIEIVDVLPYDEVLPPDTVKKLQRDRNFVRATYFLSSMYAVRKLEEVRYVVSIDFERFGLLGYHSIDNFLGNFNKKIGDINKIYSHLSRQLNRTYSQIWTKIRALGVDAFLQRSGDDALIEFGELSDQQQIEIIKILSEAKVSAYGQTSATYVSDLIPVESFAEESADAAVSRSVMLSQSQLLKKKQEQRAQQRSLQLNHTNANP